MTGKRRKKGYTSDLARMERRLRAQFDGCIIGAEGKNLFGCRKFGRAANQLKAVRKLLEDTAKEPEGEGKTEEPVFSVAASGVPQVDLGGPKGTPEDDREGEGT